VEGRLVFDPPRPLVASRQPDTAPLGLRRYFEYFDEVECARVLCVIARHFLPLVRYVQHIYLEGKILLWNSFVRGNIFDILVAIVSQLTCVLHWESVAGWEKIERFPLEKDFFFRSRTFHYW
jgi:hypothetical protein